MSYVYQNEPKTSGKVIFKTSAGDLEVELWAKETPLACRNFIQLCMEGYYDDTIFHRVVKGFIVQGGDPTGTGFGGESIYGKPFDDEFHSRLKFTHRGLLAMANSKPNSNQSQFFFTLSDTPELNGKNTIFGKVVGDTLFNLLKIGELQVDEDEKPIYQAKLIETIIVNNPFKDIIPRTTKEQRIVEQATNTATEVKAKGVRSQALLSFDNEGAERSFKMKSTHDAINDPKLLKTSTSNAAIEMPSSATVKGNQVDANKKRTLAEGQEVQPMKKQAKETDVTLEKIKQLEQELRNRKNPKKEPVAAAVEDKSLIRKYREEYLRKGKAVQASRIDTKGDIDSQLTEFQETLKTANYEKPVPAKQIKSHESTWECSLHFINNCSSCRDTFGQIDDDDDQGWMSVSLQFPKEVGANVFKPKVDDYTVIDPRAGYWFLTSVKADPFGRDILVKGDIEKRQHVIWRDKSTRAVKSQVDQYMEQPYDRRD